MTNPNATHNDETPKQRVLGKLEALFGSLRRIGGSKSLFEVGKGARIYVRYSKIHGQGRTFYGLRRDDLLELEGRASLICFVWGGQFEPLFLPYSEFENVFSEIDPAPDGQYKVQVLVHEQGTELYVARAGRFNVDAYLGWSTVETLVGNDFKPMPTLDHAQVQTLLGSIGSAKGFAVWVPQNNRATLDWTLANRFECCEILPPLLGRIQNVSQEIDVIWLRRGSSDISAMFEVEHSTAISSGLLRFNDVHLTAPQLVDRFTIVADDRRRDRYVRQLGRPTFQLSGLAERCSFMNYQDVFRWHNRLHR